MRAVAARSGSAGEGGDQRGARRRPDADLGLAAEVGDREPSAVELTEPKVELDAELIGPEVGVRADETWLLIHARIVGTVRDTSSVAKWSASAGRRQPLYH